MLALAAAGGYLALCAALFALQRQLVFPRPAPAPLTERLAKVVHIAGSQPTVAWHLAAPPGAPTVLHFHGNGSQLAHEEWLALRCKERGLGWLGVEYPGYGAAPGEPSEQSVLAAAEGAARWLEQRGVARADMALLGQSLGTGPAVYLASRGYGRALVLLTPYTALSDVGARAFPWLPVRLLMRDKMPAGEWAPKVSAPTLVFHGTADQVIPLEIGRGLAGAIGGAELVVLEGVGHDGIWDQPGVTERILEFLARPPAPSPAPAPLPSGPGR